MPSFNDLKDLSAKTIFGVHKRIFLTTKGRIGGRAFGMPVLMLSTIGRRSGAVRTTMLTSPLQDGDEVIIIGSYGGDNRDPTWFLNLRDNPEVQITMQGRTRKMKARVASPDEKDALWPRITAKYRGYGAYQRRTDRDIPVVILSPA